MEQLLLILLVALVPFALWYGWYRRVALRHLHERLEQVAGELNEPTMQLHDVLESLRRNIELVRSTFTPEEAAEIVRAGERHLVEGDALIVQRSGLTEHGRRPRAGLNPDPLNEAIGSWQGLRRDTEEVLARMRAEDQRLTSALLRARRAPQRLERALELIEEVRSAAAEAEERGFLVSTETERAALAEESAAEIRRLLDENRFQVAEAPLTELLDTLTRTRDSLLSLRRRRSELANRLAELGHTQEELEQSLAHAAESHRALTRQYAYRVWSGLDIHIDQGREESERAAAEVDTLERELSAGDLGRAEKAAAKAAAAQDEARRELAVPVDRLLRMRELAATLPERKDAMLARVAGLGKQAAADKATRSFCGVTKELQAQLTRLELTAAQPDWLELEQRLNEVEQLLTGLEIGIRHTGVVARDQQRHIERLRRWNEESRPTEGRHLPRSWWD